MAFEDPNAFDGKTPRESTPLVLQGIENFYHILQETLPEGMRSTEELLDLGDNRKIKISYRPRKVNISYYPRH